MEKVSVIIPVYNAQDTIRKCVESVINQTYKEIEILLIDDGSKDQSLEVIKSINDDRIRVVSKQNEGAAKTRNKGIELATGKYITFIDNDDFIDKEYIERHITQIGDNDVIISGYRRPDQNGIIVKELRLKETEWAKLMVLAPWAKVYKKQYLTENNITFLDNNIGEDVFFNLQAMLLSEKIKILDYIGYNWLVWTKSVSNTIQKDFRQLDVFNLLDNCYRVLEEESLLETKKEIIETHFFRYIVWFLSFTTKKRTYKEISDEYDKLFLWLKKRFPTYKKNRNIGFGKPKGEVLKVRQLLCWFMIFHKLKLGKIVVWMYSKI